MFNPWRVFFGIPTLAEMVGLFGWMLDMIEPVFDVGNMM
jgi:hypothetical protein